MSELQAYRDARTAQIYADSSDRIDTILVILIVIVCLLWATAILLSEVIKWYFIKHMSDRAFDLINHKTTDKTRASKQAILYELYEEWKKGKGRDAIR